MDAIIVTRKGIMDTPILVKHAYTASAVFRNLAEELAGEDAEEISFNMDTELNDLNSLIKHKGITVEWFTELEVNDYNNNNTDELGVDSIVHLELRSDIEDDNVQWGDGTYDQFRANGRISCSPDTWEIENQSTDEIYQYDSITEYENDLKILGL